MDSEVASDRRWIVNNSDGNMYRSETERALLVYTTSEKANEQIAHFAGKHGVSLEKIGSILDMDRHQFCEFLDAKRSEYPNLYLDATTPETRIVEKRLETATYLRDYKKLHPIRQTHLPSAA